MSEQVTRLQCGNEGCTVLHPAGFASASLKHSGHLKAATHSWKNQSLAVKPGGQRECCEILVRSGR